MRIALHEFVPYAFPVQLSRALVARGHVVQHSYFPKSVARAALSRRADDPEGFILHGVAPDHPYDKYKYLARIRQERSVGALLARDLKAFNPDVVVFSNTPDDVLTSAARNLPRDLPLVWWVQDIYSIGIESVLSRKSGLVGRAAGAWYRGLERAFGARARRVIAITQDFLPELARRGMPASKVDVIENWAPLDEIVPVEKENAWKREQGLAGRPLVVYSGILGLKHNPLVLADAAQRLAQAGRGDVAVVVVSNGPAAERLAEEQKARNLENLRVLPWQPFERLSEVLSSADVLVALIEKEAGQFSVPSKVLSYMCVGRAMLCAIPAENLAARTVVGAGAGLIVEPDDNDGFCSALERLLAAPDLRERMAANARAHATRAFDIERITDQFEAVLRKATAPA
ncbi:glycosyltransferase family 4 protein [Zavarzinia sp. CC-PAN008]|uniref:glycosyltransferase family 4 protein n=1 Tax=Zavarzinia sp. CC-PAN008 TaxID=3243332 RepID=UPI003F745CA7